MIVFPQLNSTIPDIVEETKVDVAFPNLRFRHLVGIRLRNKILGNRWFAKSCVSDHLRKDQVLSAENLTGRRHAGEGGGDSERDLSLAVHLPAGRAEAVLTSLRRRELGFGEVEGTDRAVELLEGRYVRGSGH